MLVLTLPNIVPFCCLISVINEIKFRIMIV